MVRLLAPTLLVALGGIVAAASPPQRVEPPTLSVRTDLVTLSVTVVDRHGGLVTGLRAEHFTVYDEGEPQTIQFFTSEALPATVGLLMDSSGSTRGRDDVRAAVGASFAAMGRPLDEVFTLSFNEAVWPGLVTTAQGMTALYDGIDRGLEYLEHGTRDRKVLIVVSDGGDNASERTLDDVLGRARRADAAIYAVTLVDPDNRDARPRVLRTLAHQTGGDVLTAKRPEDVAQAFGRIAQEVRTGYSIGFAPAETVTGGFRSIRVRVDAGDRRQLIARTRAGYHAGPSSDAGR